MSALRCCSVSSDTDIIFSAIASGWAEANGLNAVDLWFERSWGNFGKDGNTLSEVTLGGTSASTPGEDWLMSI